MSGISVHLCRTKLFLSLLNIGRIVFPEKEKRFIENALKRITIFEIMKYFVHLIVILALSSACGVPMGDRVDGENLSVYYLEGVEKKRAVQFATYWQERGFAGDRKQTIQLEHENGEILVKIIERKAYQNDELSIEAQSQLQELARTLEKKIFDQKTRIVITDNTFRPIERN